MTYFIEGTEADPEGKGGYKAREVLTLMS